MIIAVGSTNLSKLKAVKMAVSKLRGSKIIRSVDVPSGVSPQPRSSAETKRGARNRARTALQATPKAIISIGMEGGVESKGTELFNTIWVCVMDRSGNTYFVNGGRFALPSAIANPIKKGGEMGIVVDKLSGELNIREGKGMIGYVTGEYVERAEEYAFIAKLAIGLWYGDKHKKTRK